MGKGDEVYPKAPLAEVVFEIRFPGEPAIECRRDELFEFVRKEMPVVKVPEMQATENFRFRKYHFASADDAFTVMVGLNSFGFSNKRYAGFADFKERLTPLFGFFCDRFKIGTLRRIGLRYINTVPFTRENGAIPLGRFFKSSFLLSPGLSERYEVCTVAFVQSVGKGHIITRIETLQEQKTQEEALLLDFDYYKTDNLQASAWAACLEESHEQTKSFFENIITDQYRDFIRGKPLL